MSQKSASELVQRTREDIDLVRTFIPRYAISELAEADLNWLVDRIGLVVSEWETMPEPTLLLPVPRRKRHLFLQKGLKPAVARYYVLLEVGRHIAADAEDAKRRAERFALCGVLVPPAVRGTERLDATAVQSTLCALHEHFGPEWYQGEFTLKLYPDVCAIVEGGCTASAWYERGRRDRLEGNLHGADAAFREGLALATARGEWRTAALCLISLGITERQRGDYPGACRYFVEAERVIDRYPTGDARARLLHEQFITEDEAGHFCEAERYAAEALQNYEPAHPSLNFLAHDLAASWMMQGRYALALEALQLLDSVLTEDRARLRLQANICRAAGAVGRRDMFEAAWDSGWELVARGSVQEEFPQALLDMAHGASSLGDFRRASLAAESAIDRARKRGEARVVFEAEAVLSAACAKREYRRGLAHAGTQDVDWPRILGRALVTSERLGAGTDVPAA